MFEYNMSLTMAKEYLKARKGAEEKNMPPQEYLVKLVNEQFGLMHPVTKVFTTL